MIEVENLSVTYRSTGMQILGRVSFTLGKGKILVILGPSGCGKTTLLKVLGGLFDKSQVDTTGHIIFSKNRTKISTVFQEPRLLPWRDVLGNVSYGLEASGESGVTATKKSMKAIKMVNLDGFEKYKPGKLSVGMKQRVNFARAIVTRPEILLLDEPFSALDVENKDSIIEDFKKIIQKEKISVIFVTHSAQEALTLADHIVVLSAKPSKIVGSYSKSEFIKNNIEVESYFDPYLA